MAYSFRGGIHPGTHADPGYKSATNTKPIEKLALPDEVILPVSMHIGAPAKPIVSVGDTVDLGQPIAEAGGFVSAPVHATVSGKVKAIEPRLHPNGSKVLSIVIENDGEDRKHESVHPYDFASMSNEERIECIRSAGIVGHGGATFPTHVKIQSGIGKCDTVIINAAECEPYITSDHRLLLERPEETIGGLKMLADIMGVQTAIIAIEENKKDTFAKIEELIADDSRLKLYPLTCKYPQGAERQLIYATTGRAINSTMLPADAGCIVDNVDTVVSVYEAVAEGKPLMQRIVTVTGDGVNTPSNFRAPVGMDFQELLDAAGGLKGTVEKVISGGPMMGFAMFDYHVPVTKTTSALLVLTKDEVSRSRATACINCGRCVSECPEHLLPTKLATFAEHRKEEVFVKYNGMECCECGCCSYVCPAKRPLVQEIRSMRKMVMANRKKK